MKNLRIYCFIFLIFSAVRYASSQEIAPARYVADSLLFTGKHTSLVYSTVITTPDTKGKYPAVIIVSGTGMQDKDGTMGGHTMFKDIADYLSRRGVIVLRMDDRGVGKSTGDYIMSTTADFAADVLEAFDFAKKLPRVDSLKIGLMGHSEGGAVSAIAASKESGIAFVISLAGLAQNGYDALITQNKDAVDNAPISQADKRRFNDINEKMFKTAYIYADSPGLEAKLNETYLNWKKKDDAYVKAAKIRFDHFRFPIYSYVKEATGPWYRYFVRYNAQAVMSKIKVPVLALNGDRDIMVSCRQNLNNWKNYISGTDVTTIVIPGVNHLFLHCKDCSEQEVLPSDSHFSREALSEINDWITKRFKK